MTTKLGAMHGEVRDGPGRVVPGATITVRDMGTATLSTIYTQSTASEPPPAQANPFTADANGFWAFSAAIGLYDITIAGNGLATQYRYRVYVGGIA